MAIILNIDTAVESASLCLSRDGEKIGFDSNERQKDQASWMHAAIQRIMMDAGLELKELDAVAVTIGPGSYTGLRIGLAAAKGLCFALNIPLITIPTLEMMAFATIHEDTDLFGPLIDARRMEVFAGIYDRDLQPVQEPAAMVIDENSFQHLIATRRILFSGNGSKKLQKVLCHRNVSYSDIRATAEHMKALSDKAFRENKFADLAYTEPLYLKEFHTTAR